MTDPEAWSNADMTELERQLLDAARNDRVPSALKQRMAGALVAHGATTGGAGASAGANGGGLLFSKVGLWGFLTLALLGGAGAWFVLRPDARADTGRGTPRTLTPQPTASAIAWVREPLVEHPAVAHAERAVTASAESKAALVPHVTTTAAEPGANRSGDLREEVALLDRAREALDAGSNQLASRVLDQHQQHFAHGALRPEADVLRIEILVRLGASERAQRLSQHFLHSYPSHPLRERVNELIASLETRARPR